MNKDIKERVLRELKRENPSAVFITMILESECEKEGVTLSKRKALPEIVAKSVSAACDLFGVSDAFVEGLDRKQENVSARRFCALYLNNRGYRDVEIARYIGSRHRTSVIYAVKKLRDEISVYPDVRDKYNEFKELIESNQEV